MASNTSSRAKNAFNNILWGIVGKLISIIGPFIIRSLMIVKMGGEYAGLSSLFTSVLQVLNLAELGVSSAIVFSMYQPIAENNLEKVCSLYNFYKKAYKIIGTIILVVGMILIPFIPYLVNGDVPENVNLIYLYLIYLFNTVISYFMFGYKEAVLTAYQRSDVASNIVTIANAFLYLTQIFFVVAVPSYYLYSLMIPISTILSNLIRSYIVNKMYPDIVCEGNLDTEEKRDLYKRIAGLMLYKLSQVFRNSFDSIVLSMFLGLMAVTKYQNYYYVMNSVAALLSILSNAIIAGIGNSVVTESPQKNQKDLQTFYMLYNWLSGWCTICLLCLYQDFMEMWLGKEYLLSQLMVVLFCVYFYSMRIGDVAAVYRQATGLWWEDKMRPVIESLVNLMLNIIVVKKYGMPGVLISTIVSIVFINIPWASYILYKNYFKTSVVSYYLRIVWNSGIVVLAMIITYTVCIYVPCSGILAFGAKGLICCIVPNLIFYLFYCRTTEFVSGKNIIRRMVHR